MTESMSERNGAIPISSRKMVRFTPNMPVELALQCTDGVRVEGRYGDRVKYTLTDDRTMYLDPFVAERIKNSTFSRGKSSKSASARRKRAIAKLSIGWYSAMVSSKVRLNAICSNLWTERTRRGPHRLQRPWGISRPRPDL